MKLSAKAINLVVQENVAYGFVGRRQAEILRKKLKRLEREGKLNDNFMSTPGQNQIDWGYRIFAANMLIGDLSWWGWECRSKWAWELSNYQWFYPRWNGKPCKLLVLAEQGIGDEILFSSCARELAKENPDLHWEIDHRLIPIMKRSIPEVHWITRWKSHRPDGDNEPYSLRDYRGSYDAFIPAGNVPKLFRTTKGSFPRKPFLVPRETFQEFSGKSGFISQAGAAQEKKTNYEGLGEINLHHKVKLEGVENSYPEDFEDFISIVSSLKEVNSVPSALTHLCGAIGQKCNVIMPEKIRGERNTILKWYYPLHGGKMDWYGDHVHVYPSRKNYENTRHR